MDTVTLPRTEIDRMRRELATLRKTRLYRRLLEFEENIAARRFTRSDLGL